MHCYFSSFVSVPNKNENTVGGKMHSMPWFIRRRPCSSSSSSLPSTSNAGLLMSESDSPSSGEFTTAARAAGGDLGAGTTWACTLTGTQGTAGTDSSVCVVFCLTGSGESHDSSLPNFADLTTIDFAIFFGAFAFRRSRKARVEQLIQILSLMAPLFKFSLLLVQLPQNRLPHLPQ